MKKLALLVAGIVVGIAAWALPAPTAAKPATYVRNFKSVGWWGHFDELRAQAKCPPERTAVGGGWEVVPASDGPFFHVSVSRPRARAWEIVATKTKDDIFINIWVVCAR